MTDGAERLLAVGGVAFAAVLLTSGVIDDDQTDAYLLGLASFFLVGFLGALRAVVLLSATDHWALTVALGPFAAWAAATAVLLLRPKTPAPPATNGHRPRP